MKLITIGYSAAGERIMAFPPVQQRTQPEATEDCPQCRRPMMDGYSHPRRPSRDHILPKSRGGYLVIHDDVRNWRPMCQECNGLLAAAYHCVGAAACARDVAAATDRKVKTVLRGWGFSRIVMALIRRDIGVVRRQQCEATRRAFQASAPTLGDVWR